MTLQTVVGSNQQFLNILKEQKMKDVDQMINQLTPRHELKFALVNKILGFEKNSRMGTGNPSGYDLDKLKDEYGAKYFRSLRVIKNSYGEDDIRIGMGFLGQIGMFKELNRKKDMTEADYEAVVNKSWFLK